MRTIIGRPENSDMKRFFQPLTRRVINRLTPSDFLHPKEIYELINGKPWDYGFSVKHEYAIRDRALMSLAFASVGRISAITGGWKYRWDDLKQMSFKTREKHTGLLRENFDYRLVDEETGVPSIIWVKNMKVVKRTPKVIEKHGLGATTRPPFNIPLKEGILSPRFFDQLIPFGWLIYEYLETYAPEKGRLFPFGKSRAWQIVKTVTGMYPHWFRAQSENFYANFIIKDVAKLGKMIRVQDLKSIGHYTDYSAESMYKDVTQAMDFDWIPREVAKIKKRILETKRRLGK